MSAFFFKQVTLKIIEEYETLTEMHTNFWSSGLATHPFGKALVTVVNNCCFLRTTWNSQLQLIFTTWNRRQLARVQCMRTYLNPMMKWSLNVHIHRIDKKYLILLLHWLWICPTLCVSLVFAARHLKTYDTVRKKSSCTIIFHIS